MKQINISRSIINKIVVGLVWFVIPLLVLGSVLLFFELLDSKINIIKQAIVLFGIIMILIFAFILIILSTKYRKEMLLNDTERKKKWKLLRKDFRDFHKKMIIYEATLFIFIMISGIFMLFNHDSDKFSGVLMIIIGFLLLVGTIKQVRELKKMDRK